MARPRRRKKPRQGVVREGGTPPDRPSGDDQSSSKPAESQNENQGQSPDPIVPPSSGSIQKPEEAQKCPPQFNSPDTGEVSWIGTKFALLRLLGAVYFVGFLGAYYQNRGLMGDHGLQPAASFFNDRLRSQFDDPWEGIQKHPSIFWYVEINDDNLDILYKAGLTLSGLVVLGVDSMILLFGLWAMYFSVITSASSNSFYNYGWESQLLETGFLAIFLCDVWPSWGKGRSKSPPSPIVLWLFRWLCFRISMGAGLIKLRGDSCWTEKTCLDYHFETQPLPSPMSFIFHFLPKWALSRGVELDLLVQVYTSWMVLCPTYIPGSRRLSTMMLWIVRIGGFMQAGFMVNILLSGNFAFLNHLTIIPALACLDDHCWPEGLVRLSQSEAGDRRHRWLRPRLAMDLYLLWLIGTLSQPVVENLLQVDGNHQQMNASFGSLRLVNTYGAFGSVGEARYEAIVSVTYNGRDWVELEFPCKPGTLTRRPCFCAPYHYRLDWNVWFVGFKPHDAMLHGRENWMFSLLAKLLDKDAPERPWMELLDRSSADMLRTNYYAKFQTPMYAKVDMYQYVMAAPLWEILPRYLVGDAVQWWNRTFEEVLIPPVELDTERGRLVVAQT